MDIKAENILNLAKNTNFTESKKKAKFKQGNFLKKISIKTNESNF